MGRMERVNQLMKREIGGMIQREIQDPRLQFVSVTGVSVSPDFHRARVTFSVLGDKDRVVEAEQGLASARGYIRRLVAKKVQLRITPEIEFVYDPSIEYSVRIEKTFADINQQSAGEASDVPEENC
ncbi:MAG: 30S ribosome-binding factor RbfA [Candidatus Omnitrophica bacterium]|nr:30S ribosome-binding factor RbfA [Candidatus Omnitrophota bacterium]